MALAVEAAEQMAHKSGPAWDRFLQRPGQYARSAAYKKEKTT